MTPIFGADFGGPEMSGPTAGHLIGHIRNTNAVRAFHALSRFIEDAFPTDEATPRLVDVIGMKAARTVVAN